MLSWCCLRGSRGERFLLTVGRFQTASGELLKQNLVCSNPNKIIYFDLSLSLSLSLSPPLSLSLSLSLPSQSLYLQITITEKREYFNHAVFHNFCNIWYK